MDILKAWLNNYVLWSAIAGWIIAQLIKSTIDLIYKKKLTLKDVFFSSGGMPSSHSSTVVSLCTACAIVDGLGSSTFAITAVLAIIVMIDARGVRYQTGEQSKVLNRITRELFSGKPELMNTGLKELVGHTPFQVEMGALLGFAIAIVMAFLMGKF